MVVSIENIRFEYQFNRSIAFASLKNSNGDYVLSGTLTSLLDYCDKNDLNISNAQDILVHLVCDLGYAS